MGNRFENVFLKLLKKNTIYIFLRSAFLPGASMEAYHVQYQENSR